MRLGELLIQQQLLAPEHLEEALRTQAFFGARLGTNLVEMELVDLDTLTNALSMLTGFPAAGKDHFERVKPAALQLLPARFAERHAAIPLGAVRGSDRNIVVAFRDPRELQAVDEVAFATGRRVTAAIAPELRVYFYLEKYYGIQRKARFLRVSGRPETPAPTQSQRPSQGSAVDVFAPPSAERRSYAQAAAAPPAPAATPSPGHANLPQSFSMPEAEIGASFFDVHRSGAQAATPVAGAPEPLAGTAAPALPSSPPSLAASPAATRPSGPAPLAPPTPLEDITQRISLPPVGAPPPRPHHQTQALSPPPPPTYNASEAATRIASAKSRDDIGDALVGYMRQAFACGLVTIVRDEMALGWKGFAPSIDESVIESLALPLGGPSMLKIAAESREPFRGPPPPEGSAIQTRLWKLLRTPAPLEVVAVPIVLRDRVVNLVYAQPGQGAAIADASAGELLALAAAAATGYTRLIQKTKQK